MLHAILNDEFYIFTQLETQMATAARSREMYAAFERCTNYRKEHEV